MSLKLVAVGSAVALALCGTAAARPVPSDAAQTDAPQKTAVAQDSLVGAVAVFDAAVAYLQLDKQTLFQDLRNGQSLAQIADAQGKTTGGLVDALVEAAQTQLDLAVSAGKLGSAKEQALLTKLRTALTTLVTKTHAASTPAGTRPRPVTMFFQPLLARIQLHIVTAPDKTAANKLKLKIGAGTTVNGGNS